ncbi:helix-turn-helix domain-containing protein [Spirosoma linguale]|uniref:Transcriptional regulator, AraC family n=1 Tax=Spirosoma linguale (strain ATCC 33905 / DSM 74 / LMG 10896 / Claus 1) TaxID=504472 RepID=D2QQ77_SPILD|nr:transcriptional regulator, AraC family [Spirosoma linguale DSM 74]
MVFRVIQPSPFLRQYIRSYMLCHIDVDPSLPAPVKAYPVTPEEGMTFHIRGQLRAETPELNLLEKRAKTVFFGCPNARQNLILSHEFMLAHVWFMPGALYKLLQVPMSEFVHQNIDAELIWGRDIREVNDQLANAPDYDSIFRILDAFFWKKTSRLSDDNRPIDRIGQLIFDNPQGFRLDKVADQACLSQRQFEKRFIQQVGVSPKFFARISRFWKAYKLKENNPTLDWLSIAIQFGYVDVQHLVKDCRQFANTTPNILMKENAQSPEFYPGIAVYRP